MAASGSSAKGFGSLFRSSAFASLDAGSRQALSAPRRQRANGNWGLKHDLPKDIRPTFVQISALDDPLTKAGKVQSAGPRVRLIQRWNEVMPPVVGEPAARREALSSFYSDPDSGAPTDAPKPEYLNIAALPRDQWRAKVAEARRLANQKAGEQADLVQDLHLRVNKDKNYSDIPASNSIFAAKPLNDPNPIAPGATTPVHPPTYRYLPAKLNAQGTKKDTPDHLVKGRILNNNTARVQHMSVGIGGVVAHLPYNKSSEVRDFSRETLHEFIVQHAEFNEFAEPEVVVKMEQSQQSWDESRRKSDSTTSVFADRQGVSGFSDAPKSRRESSAQESSEAILSLLSSQFPKEATGEKDETPRKK
ncbi:hypothetical protein DFS34DRAFT_603887 [Phlyctochytrium arcticum]|nr:hypothetical protein DFS34DRAFT_603887 [Phlyctochytrium arcticum]